jgi:RND family efflux transporter MFP subunit
VIRRLLVPLLCTLAAGCEAPVAGEPEAARPVRVHRVELAPALESRTFVARTEAVQVLDLSFRVGGRLQHLAVREGQVLRKGDLVAELDTADYARALHEAEVELRQAGRDLQRKRALWRRQVVPRAVVDDAMAAFDLRRIGLDKARQDLADTRLTAPFDALVSQRLLDSFVNLRAGEPVVRLLDLTEIRVTVNVPEDLLARVRAEQVAAVQARFAFAAGRTFPLQFREYAAEADPLAQTYEVTFAMARPPDVNLLPGMTATVSVDLRGDSRPIAIPAVALHATDDGGFAVWRYDPGSGRVTRQDVALDGVEGGQARVRDGLEGGELILTAGVAHAREGMRVSPLPAAPP